MGRVRPSWLRSVTRLADANGLEQLVRVRAVMIKHYVWGY